MLIQCYECGKEISSTAVSCPHCGAVMKHGKMKCHNFMSMFKFNVTRKLFFQLFGFAVLLIALLIAHYFVWVSLWDPTIRSFDEDGVLNSCILFMALPLTILIPLLYYARFFLGNEMCYKIGKIMIPLHYILAVLACLSAMGASEIGWLAALFGFVIGFTSLYWARRVVTKAIQLDKIIYGRFNRIVRNGVLLLICIGLLKMMIGA